MGFQIERIDHIVLTVADIERSCAFYEKALGMVWEVFGDGRVVETRRSICIWSARNRNRRPPLPGPGPGICV